ncbi:MAG: DUF1573 domain-containing protein, partial [Chitinophagaceae bacterium]
ALGSGAQDKKAEEVMKVNSENHNFGKIKQGVPVTTEFVISNISDQPLIIETVTAGCGCTTPKWGKEPVMAGGKSKIEVGFNAQALGGFTKEVYVKLAGVTQPKIIKITGEVVDAATYEASVKTTKTVTAPKVQASSKLKVKTTSKKTKIKSDKA